MLARRCMFTLNLNLLLKRRLSKSCEANKTRFFPEIKDMRTICFFLPFLLENKINGHFNNYFNLEIMNLPFLINLMTVKCQITHGQPVANWTEDNTKSTNPCTKQMWLAVLKNPGPYAHLHFDANNAENEKECILYREEIAQSNWELN